jgi:hypothetical protein
MRSKHQVPAVRDGRRAYYCRVLPSPSFGPRNSNRPYAAGNRRVGGPVRMPILMTAAWYFLCVSVHLTPISGDADFHVENFLCRTH